jgi:radical SAM superfamily enzyme YgiQ (UPF0313 family)
MSDTKKIFFIYPPSERINRDDKFQKPLKGLFDATQLPPTDLMYLAAVAENITEDFDGNPISYEAKIKDYSLFDGNQLAEFESDLKNFAPDYLVLNVSTTTFQKDMSVLKIAKNIFPEIITIVKGAFFLTNKTGVLYDYKDLDYVIIGEAEETLKEILQNKNPKDIQGLGYRDGFVAKYTGKRPFILDLDKLPFPARHLINNDIYKCKDKKKTFAVIEVSRGCPHHCFFCISTPFSGSFIRKRSPESIIEEVKECIDKYNIKNFMFRSDNFNDDSEWTISLCTQIIESGLKISWKTNSHVANLDEDVADLMSVAGCKSVILGVESGSQFILDKIGKKVTIDQIREAVKCLNASKIKVYTSFVIGLPWDDEYTIEDTIDFAIELGNDFAIFNIVAPLPGTRLYNYVRKNKLTDKKLDWSKAYCEPIVKTHFLSKEKVLELQTYAIKRFYLRPRCIFKLICCIKSFSEFKYNCKLLYKVARMK